MTLSHASLQLWKTQDDFVEAFLRRSSSPAPPPRPRPGSSWSRLLPYIYVVNRQTLGPVLLAHIPVKEQP